MANGYQDITFKVKTEHAIRLRDGLCGYFDYDQNQNEGESKQDFALRMLRHQVKVWVKSHELKEARNAVTVEDIEVTE